MSVKTRLRRETNRTTGKQRRKVQLESTPYIICHLCGHHDGTLKVERKITGEKVRLADGKRAYYHVVCKTTQIMNNVINTEIEKKHSEELHLVEEPQENLIVESMA